MNTGKYIKYRYNSTAIKITGRIIPLVKNPQIIRITGMININSPITGRRLTNPEENPRANDAINKIIPAINENLFFITKVYQMQLAWVRWWKKCELAFISFPQALPLAPGSHVL